VYGFIVNIDAQCVFVWYNMLMIPTDLKS